MKLRLVYSLLLISALIFAEPYTIKKMDMENGLSNSNIVSITQDRRGYLWFATESGLNRFDGKKFRIYKKGDIPHLGPNSNELNYVLADKTDDIVWIATQRTGLNAFDTKTERFRYYLARNHKDSLATNDVTYLAHAPNNNIWLSTYHFGVEHYDKKANKFTHYNTSTVPGMVSNHVWSVADDFQGNLYIGHVFNGLSVLSLKDKKIKNFIRKPGQTHQFPGVEVICILIDSQKRVWIGTENGLALYHPKTNDFTVFKNIQGDINSLSNNRISSMHEMDDHHLWIGVAPGGVNILDLRQDFTKPENVVFQHIEANDDKSGLSNPVIKSLFQDNYKNIWIGTYGGGVNVIPNDNPFFSTYAYSPLKGAKNGLSAKMVSGIITDAESKVWVGTDGGGIDVYKDGIKVNQYNRLKNNLISNYVSAVTKDQDGNLWFGTGNGILIKYDIKSGQFKNIVNLNLKVGVFSIFEDSNRNLWLSTYMGLCKYNPETGESIIYTPENSALPDNVIMNVAQDDKGQIWVGTFGQGLTIFTPDFKLIRSYNTYKNFCSNAIHHIYKDSKNRMWIATRDGLVLFENSKDTTYKVFNTKDGMADSYVCAIQEGANESVWFSTNSGIGQYLIRENKFKSYNYLDGVPWGNFIIGSSTKSKNGVIYFGSQNGVCYFNANQTESVSSSLPAAITGFRYFDKKFKQPENAVIVPVSEKIKLKHYQNTFTISFNVLNFGKIDQTEYAYMLKGFEDNWNNLGNESEITFRNIPYGSYEFMVKTRIRNQEWSEEITSIKIVISPPFWLTWWAKLIYLMTTVWLIFIIVRFFKRRIELENSLYLEKQNHQKDQELNEERLGFYTNIAHELRTPLTLILGPLLDLKKDESLSEKQLGKISLIHRSANRLLNLINQIMEFRKTESKNRNLTVVRGNPGKLIREIGLKYKGLNQNPDVSFKVKIKDENLDIFYDPEVITIILDNLISNAIKYTSKGEILIELRNRKEDEIKFTEIEVRDTGVGIPADVKSRIFDRYFQVNNEHQVSGSGIGLSLVKNLAELHQGNIRVESIYGEGSSFIFSIKTDNEYPDAIHSEQISKLYEPDTENNTSKGLVLIVEDNDEIREYIAGTFRSNYDVLLAENGEIGISLAFEHIPDIIISDIMMPVIDGTELCMILKQDVRTSHIPLILLTAKDTIQDKASGYAVGADSYIVKPFSSELLINRVNNLIESRRKMAELYAASGKDKKTIVTDALNQLDKEFIDRIVAIVEENLEAEQINIGFIAERMNMSHSTLYRKVKALTNKPINDLVRKVKIQNAEQLLLTGKYSVSEVGYLVGINSSSYFRQCFKDEFNMSPSDYLKQFVDKKGDE